MLKDNYLDRFIGEKLSKENDKAKSERKPSGKLSASKLYLPVQWQILTNKFKLTSKLDDYTLRKFQRGKDVEDWFISQISPKETQKFLEYRGVIGYCDSIVDTSNWDNPVGVIPLEVKSITNMNFKWIAKEGAKKGHIIQNSLYATAFKSDYHAISYLASDDYRVMTFIFKTENTKEEIDKIIDEYEEALKIDTIPVFKAREKWQENLKYNSFPEFVGMKEEELKIKYQELIKK